jgi:hypothetical protein
MYDEPNRAVWPLRSSLHGDADKHRMVEKSKDTLAHGFGGSVAPSGKRLGSFGLIGCHETASVILQGFEAKSTEAGRVARR